jgi:hypothetical protein
MGNGGDLAIVSVCKDVTLLREMGDMALVRLRKGVMLLWESEYLAIVRVIIIKD